MKNSILIALFSVFLFSCNVAPQPITYGTDACHFCNMTIVDRQHASQLVNSKGKAYKFDAIECMVHSLQDEFKPEEIALFLVADFNKPGEWLDANSASFLVSDQIASPMGANLSAFENQDVAQKMLEKFTGKRYSWKEIQEHLKQE